MEYGKNKWKTKRSKILRKDKYKDVLAQRYGKTIEATIVHHIYPAEDYPEYAYCDWNLISVSAATHNKLHIRGSHELSEEGLRLLKRTTPGIDWRNKHGTKA